MTKLIEQTGIKAVSTQLCTVTPPSPPSTMVDMLEGVEDICASLGLGHIPLLNEENRELNRKLQELQVKFINE